MTIFGTKIFSLFLCFCIIVLQSIKLLFSGYSQKWCSLFKKAFCVVEYGKFGSLVRVQRSFRLRYQLPRHADVPDKKRIKEWFYKFLDSGNVKRKKRTKTKWIRTELKVGEVIESFRQDPHATARESALQDNLPSASTICRILHEAKFHPYKMKHRQEISEVNRRVRVEHAINQLGLFDVSESILNNVLFSDECNFHIHGGINHQNFRYLSQRNPHWHGQEPLHSPRITVWAAIGRRGVIGSIFFDENVNGVNYLRMLQDEFLPRAFKISFSCKTEFRHIGLDP